MNTENSGEGNGVEVRSENLEPPSWTGNLVQFTKRILTKLDLKGWEVSILLTDDETIRGLNRMYRGFDTATDVLSFGDTPDTGESAEIPGLKRTGDIVLALPFIEAQAKQFSVPFNEEVRRMVIHGVLHLAGYTHDTNDFRLEPMLVLQEQILNELKEKLF